MCEQQEEWRPIPEFAGRYEASSDGRIRSIFNGFRARMVPVILSRKPVKNGKGYLLVDLCVEGRTVERFVHRLVAMAFHDNPVGKPQVAHLNGVPSDNRAANLVWATQRENDMHKLDHGRKVSGNAVLTKSQIEEIKRLFPARPSWPSVHSVAARMGVSESAVRSVINGKTWSDVGNGRFLLKPIEDANIPS